MNENIIIDGYNLLRQSDELVELERIDLELARNHLIKMLSGYKRAKSLKIVVVFDAHISGNLSQSSYMEKGIRVLFSKVGQSADDLIKKMARETGKELVVVTNDHDIIDSIKRMGNISISSNDFLMKIEMAKYFLDKGIDEEDGESDSKITTRKKGNPRKLSKAERKKKRGLKKL